MPVLSSSGDGSFPSFPITLIVVVVMIVVVTGLMVVVEVVVVLRAPSIHQHHGRRLVLPKPILLPGIIFTKISLLA